MGTFTRREAISRMGLALGGALAAGVSQEGCKTGPRSRAARRPNFVVIYADDLGYGDLGCYGADKIKTPNLDRMAAQGLRFTDFYSCSPVCTPSRAGLLTGRYPVRSGLQYVLSPASQTGVDDWEITLPELLKPQGYATACVGKWHLGHLPQYLPTRHGFDRYFGIPYSNDMDNPDRGYPPIPLMRQETIIEQPVDQRTLTQRYTAEAIQFIRETKAAPFFLYLAHNMPHVPLHVSDAFAGRSARGLYGDVVEEIDWSVGQVLGELDRLGLAENTLVVFSSDNGPWLVKGEDAGSAGPLRAGKATTFEGGIRVPCIAWWPGRIPAGHVTHHPAIMLDWFSTFGSLAGAEIPQDRPIDGRNIVRTLFSGKPRPDEEFFFYWQERLETHRSGPWKLKKVFEQNSLKETFLFNLETDPGETTDLASKHPRIVSRLERHMAAFARSLGKIPVPKR